MTVRILLVEDQAIVRNGLKLILEQDEEFQVIVEAGNGIEALSRLEHTHVDLVLMDVRMPEMNGIEATKRIKSLYPNLKVIILTTFEDDEYAYQTLKDGANGFLLKSSEPEKLLSSIHSVLSGGLVLQEDIAAKLMPKLLRQSVVAKDVEIQLSLTERELSIVKLVGEGKSNKEIANSLFLSIGTVKNHITNILQELDLRDRTQLAIYAVKNGLV
ncbi:response regulator transcription factor [Ureibacillus sinduriensis]|uniref:LuxR family transcriptional regulator n=1 Tax=Ureibacillus sinduriensis BLB-1 = JCM 15800 TaxID=1384057 RepID=A0A0A3IIA3_9BACL|nr:response regulator transcription factor [Ureibacillus sinduriensis]KGR74587.1 LuxR family transcriptional regulator [Ureibacillus sinduriensis BLB-1 = JCM 15800]